MSALVQINTASELENALSEVEQRLAALGEALRERSSSAVDLHSTELHRALARAVDQFSRAAHSGTVPPTLRRRLAAAGGQVAAQREALARATAALDRAIDILIPRDNPVLYSNLGGTERASRGGTIQA